MWRFRSESHFFAFPECVSSPLSQSGSPFGGITDNGELLCVINVSTVSSTLNNARTMVRKNSVFSIRISPLKSIIQIQRVRTLNWATRLQKNGKKPQESCKYYDFYIKYRYLISFICSKWLFYDFFSVFTDFVFDYWLCDIILWCDDIYKYVQRLKRQCE